MPIAALTMDIGSYAVVLALFAGSVRALILWRATIGVEVVNVVVLNALGEGRGRDLPTLLRGSGSAPYLDVASAIAASLLRLRGAQGLPKRLRHDARAAVVAAGRRLKRQAWLDHVALAAIAFAGIDAAVHAAASGFKAGGLLAATLLWFANVRGASSIATRMHAGAEALVDSMLSSLERVPEFAE
jgi:hypothetical protein